MLCRTTVPKIAATAATMISEVPRLAASSDVFAVPIRHDFFH
jgi:hypothetical protein